MSKASNTFANLLSVLSRIGRAATPQRVAGHESCLSTSLCLDSNSGVWPIWGNTHGQQCSKKAPRLFLHLAQQGASIQNAAEDLTSFVQVVKSAKNECLAASSLKDWEAVWTSLSRRHETR